MIRLAVKRETIRMNADDACDDANRHSFAGEARALFNVECASRDEAS